MPRFFKPNTQAAAKHAEEAQKRQSERAVFGIPKGKCFLRILPPISEAAARDGKIGLLYYRHYIFDEFIVCPSQTWPEKFDNCPICDAVKEMKRKGMRGTADRARANGNTLVAAVVRSGGAVDSKEDRVSIVRGPYGLYDFLTAELANTGRGAVGDFTDPDSGTDLIVEKRGTKQSTKYYYTWDRQSSEALPGGKLDKVEVPDVFVFLKEPDESDIAEMESIAKRLLKKAQDKFDDGDVDRDREGDEDERPSSRRRDRGDDRGEDDRGDDRRSSRRDRDAEDDRGSPRRDRAEDDRGSARRERDDDDRGSRSTRSAKDDEERRPARNAKDDEERRPAARREREPEEKNDEDRRPSSRDREDDREEQRPSQRRAAKEDEPEERARPSQRRREPDAEPEEKNSKPAASSKEKRSAPPATNDDTPEDVPTSKPKSKVEKPKIDPETNRPVCWKDWVVRNPTGDTTDPQCEICTVEVNCAQAAKKAQAANN